MTATLTLPQRNEVGRELERTLLRLRYHVRAERHREAREEIRQMRDLLQALDWAVSDAHVLETEENL